MNSVMGLGEREAGERTEGVRVFLILVIQHVSYSDTFCKKLEKIEIELN